MKHKYNMGVAGKYTSTFKKGKKVKYALGLASAGGEASSSAGSFASVGGGLSSIGGYVGALGDIAGLWASTQGDEKAARTAGTLKSVSSAMGTVGNEFSKNQKTLDDVSKKSVEKEEISGEELGTIGDISSPNMLRGFAKKGLHLKEKNKKTLKFKK